MQTEGRSEIMKPCQTGLLNLCIYNAGVRRHYQSANSILKFSYFLAIIFISLYTIISRIVIQQL